MPTRWFPDGNESIFSPTSLSSKEPGLAGKKKAHKSLGVEHSKSDTHNQLSRVAQRTTGEGRVHLAPRTLRRLNICA